MSKDIEFVIFSLSVNSLLVNVSDLNGLARGVYTYNKQTEPLISELALYLSIVGPVKGK